MTLYLLKCLLLSLDISVKLSIFRRNEEWLFLVNKLSPSQTSVWTQITWRAIEKHRSGSVNSNTQDSLFWARLKWCWGPPLEKEGLIPPPPSPHSSDSLASPSRLIHRGWTWVRRMSIFSCWQVNVQGGWLKEGWALLFWTQVTHSLRMSESEARQLSSLWAKHEKEDPCVSGSKAVCYEVLNWALSTCSDERRDEEGRWPETWLYPYPSFPQLLPTWYFCCGI